MGTEATPEPQGLTVGKLRAALDGQYADAVVILRLEAEDAEGLREVADSVEMGISVLLQLQVDMKERPGSVVALTAGSRRQA